MQNFYQATKLIEKESTQIKITIQFVKWRIDSFSQSLHLIRSICVSTYCASSKGLILLADVGLPGSINYHNGPDLVPDSQVQSKQYENIGT